MKNKYFFSTFIHKYYLWGLVVIMTLNFSLHQLCLFQYTDHYFKGIYSRFGNWHGDPTDTIVGEYEDYSKKSIEDIVTRVAKQEPKLIVLVNISAFKHSIPNLYFSYDLKNFIEQENINSLEKNKLKWGIIPIRYSSTSDYSKIDEFIQSEDEYELESYSGVKDKYIFSVLRNDFTEIHTEKNSSLNFFDLNARLPIVSIEQLRASYNIQNFVKDKIVIIGPSAKSFHSNIKLGFHKQTLSLAQYTATLVDGILNKKLTTRYSLLHLLIYSLFSFFSIFFIREILRKEFQRMTLFIKLIIEIVFFYIIYKNSLLWFSVSLILFSNSLVYLAYSFFEKKELSDNQLNLYTFFNRINLPFNEDNSSSFDSIFNELDTFFNLESLTVLNQKKSDKVYHRSKSKIPPDQIVLGAKSAIFYFNEVEYSLFEYLLLDVKVLILLKDDLSSREELSFHIRDIQNILNKKKNMFKRVLRLNHLRKTNFSIAQKTKQVDSYFRATQDALEFINYPLAFFSLQGTILYSNTKFDKIMKSCNINFKKTQLIDYLEMTSRSENVRETLKNVVYDSGEFQFNSRLEMFDHFSQNKMLEVSLKNRLRSIHHEQKDKNFFCLEIEKISYPKSQIPIEEDYKDLINNAFNSYSKKIKDKKIILELSSIPDVSLDTEWDVIVGVLIDFLDLAIQDADKNTTLSVSLEKKDDVFQIEIINKGKGLITLESLIKNESKKVSLYINEMRHLSINIQLMTSLGDKSHIVINAPLGTK